MEVEICSWKAVATWKYNFAGGFDMCTICQNELEKPCPQCKIPGEDCIPISGKCNHIFHLHCITKWIDGQRLEQKEQKCPLCKADWEIGS